MSNLKTSDIWPDGYKLTFDYLPSNTSSHETFGFIFSSSEPCIFICDVVNNHDRMVEEIAELRDLLQQQREKIVELYSIGQFKVRVDVSEVLTKSEDLLNKND
ncbi:coil containing protein [Vibrio phage 1.039.O._10N.286.55.A2]|nr:coil containing protein [Vibrio phage 1.039.O._10N.286.55.A2]